SGLAEITEKLSANKKRKKRKDRNNDRVVGEITTLRKGNSKSYELSNGIRRTEYYPAEIHCFNDDTQNFEETDLSIYEDEGDYFTSGKHNFKAKFSRNASDDELFTLQKGMHKVSFKAKRTRKNAEKKLEAKLSKKRRETFEKAKKSEKNFFGDAAVLNSVDTVTYENYSKDTDIEYSICKKGVKENIVINKKQPSYHYKFLVECENVIPEYVEGQNRIIFKSEETGKEVFNIPAPYMVDAAGVVSHDVTMEMKTAKISPNNSRKATDEKYIQIMLVADSEWINADDRVFPVKIDPQTNVASDSIICLCQNCSNTTNNGETYVITTSSCCSTQTNSETSNCACQGNLTVEIKKDENISENDAVKKYLKITRKCTCGDDNLTLLLSVKTSACTSVDLTPFKKTSDACNIIYWFDITSYYGTYSSYELKVVKCENQNTNAGTTQNTSSGNTNTTSGTSSNGTSNTTTTTSSSSSCCCNSVEIFGEESAYAPSLVVEDNISFAVNFADSAIMQDFGRYGVVGVDAFRGNQIISVEDFAWSGNRMPVTIQHLYNGIFADYQYTRNDALLLKTADFRKMRIGNGWKL
ncbi:MAG: hypothetical protein J6Q87_01430, partial [Clostridia bacterium]|nr:hypothetical protein [Clostridia bacterium]